MTRPSTGQVGTWLSFTAMAEMFLFHIAFRLITDPTQPTKASFQGCRATGHEDYHSHASITKDMNVWSYNPASHTF